MTRLASADLYDGDAAARGARYAQARFEDIHADVLEYLPPVGSSILDVGAGSGRDAAALVARGYKVVAAEPSTELARWGQTHYAVADILWINDALPALSSILAMPQRYPFILCSAVLMHLPADELDQSFVTMAALLTPGGRLAASLRDHAPQDPTGIFHDHPHAVVVESARLAGFSLEQIYESPDQLERPHLSWRAYLFQKVE